METYIVRQPILDNKMNIAAYEVAYQQTGSALYNQQDARVADTILSFFNRIDEEEDLLEGKDAYITLTPNLLMQNAAAVFDPQHVIVQITETVLVHPQTKEMLLSLRERGFRLALSGFEFNRRYLDILPYVDIMKVDMSMHTIGDLRTVLAIAHDFGKKAVAYNVDSPEVLEKVRDLGVDFIQGLSVADMVSTKAVRMEHLRSNLFRLIVAITSEEPDFEEISGYVSLDVTLTYSLVKMVNSAYFALANPVKNVRQALAILGIHQLRQWIYLVSFASEDGLSNEVIKLSFVRAVFCQSVCEQMSHPPIRPSEGYLLGMFSTLGLLLHVPLSAAVEQLSIAQSIKDGLLGNPGPCDDLLGLCIALEKSNWGAAAKKAEALELEPAMLNDVYLAAAESGSRTWRELMTPFAEE